MKKESKVIFLIIIIVLGLMWWYIPVFQVNHYGTNINNSERANLENQYRVTLTQTFGGVVILYGVYQGWRRIILAEEDLKITHYTMNISQANLEVSREGQITERFTRAVDQLGAIDQFGNPAIEIRLGGIYALERIAKESKKDYLPIMEILTAYARKNSPNNEDVFEQHTVNTEVSFEIQAILTVIGRRNHLFDDEKNNCLKLNRTLLQCADLEEANFKEADFERTNLAGSVFKGANLERANLYMAYLESVDFTKANLKGVCLSSAKLFYAYFEEANLEDVNLDGANIESADFTKANMKNAILEDSYLEETLFTDTNLEGANFRKAKFKSAYFDRANLSGADFSGADLSGADFTNTNLTGAILDGTSITDVKGID